MIVLDGKHTSDVLKESLAIKIAEEKVASKLQAKVAINGNSQKGKIQIEYFSMEELEGLLEKFGVDMSS